MRKLGIALAGVVGLLAALALLHLAFVELSGPVVELESRDAEGQVHATHLWTVEVDGHSYLAAGNDGAAWLARVRARPDVVVVREGRREAVRAVPEPARREAVLAAMRARYGLGDRWVRALVGEEAVPVRLDPREP